MHRREEFKRDDAMISLYINADKRLNRQFAEMSFQELAEGYMQAVRAINELKYNGGGYMLEARCDEESKKILKTINNLEQYQKDMIEYFDSLRKGSIR